MKTLDLKKELKHLYQPSAKMPSLADVPAMRYLAIDGKSAPGDEAFQEGMQALYALAYSVRFAAKKQLELDYPVMPVEGLYRWPENTREPEMAGWDPERGPGELRWTLRIMLPDEVPESFVEKVRAETAQKGKGGPRLADVELRPDDAMEAVQMLHVGPYATEPETVAKMRAFAEERGYRLIGVHHEIYLGDPRRSAPEKLKTALRIAVAR
jgi:hypothetical protein